MASPNLPTINSQGLLLKISAEGNSMIRNPPLDFLTNWKLGTAIIFWDVLHLLDLKYDRSSMQKVDRVQVLIFLTDLFFRIVPEMLLLLSWFCSAWINQPPQYIRSQNWSTCRIIRHLMGAPASQCNPSGQFIINPCPEYFGHFG